MHRYALLDVPPARALVHHLADGLDARLVFQSVPSMWTTAQRAAEAGLGATAALASWLPHFADSVETVLEGDELPVVIGRAPALLLGTLLALKRRGRHGLLVVGPCGGVSDPLPGRSEPALLDLVLAHGSGSSDLADIEGRGPLVFAEDVVALGVASEPVTAGVHAMSFEGVQAVGIDVASGDAIDRVARPELDGFCLHVDIAGLKAVPSGSCGLSAGDVTAVLHAALDSGRTAGVQVTTGNLGIEADADTARLADFLVEGLRRPPHAAAP